MEQVACRILGMLDVRAPTEVGCSGPFVVIVLGRSQVVWKKIRWWSEDFDTVSRNEEPSHGA